jgi:hypothetical protein
LGQNESISQINKFQLDLLAFLSQEVLNPIRYADIHLLKTIITERKITIDDYFESYFAETNSKLETSVFEHAICIINGLFNTIKENKNLVKIGISRNYSLLEIINDKITIGINLHELIEIHDVKEYLVDLCDYSIFQLQKQSKTESLKNDFILNQKYTRKDVFRILQWEENPVAQNVGGYMVEKNKQDCAIFVNYHKDDSISATTKYHDRFISRNEFIWMSKNKRYLTSPDVKSISNQKEINMRIPLFVKKSNFEDTDFYYLGNINLIENSPKELTILDENKKNVPVVEFNFQLENPVEKSLFDYLLEDIPEEKKKIKT